MKKNCEWCGWYMTKLKEGGYLCPNEMCLFEEVLILEHGN